MKIQMTEQEYRKHPGINYSLLSAASKGLEALRGYFKVDVNERELVVERNKPHFRLGSALDNLVLPTGETNFVVSDEAFDASNQDYILVEAWLAAGNKVLAMEAMELFSRDLKYTDKGVEKVGLWANIKDPAKRLAKVDTPRTKAIYHYLTVNKDKIYLSTEEFAKVKAVGAQLMAHPNTKHIFEQKEGLDIIYQKPIIVDYVLPSSKTVTYKILLDIMHLNHTDKVCKIFDLKSKGEPAGSTFQKSYLAFRYNYQDALYSLVARKWLEETYPGYRFEPMSFVVTHWDTAEPPMIFEATEQVREVSLLGGQINQFRFKGIFAETVALLEQMATGQYYLTPAQLNSLSITGKITMDFDYVQASVQEENMPVVDDELPDFSEIF